MTVLTLLGLVILLLAFVFSMLGLGGALLYVPVFTWFGFEMKTVAIRDGTPPTGRPISRVNGEVP